MGADSLLVIDADAVRVCEEPPTLILSPSVPRSDDLAIRGVFLAVLSSLYLKTCWPHFMQTFENLKMWRPPFALARYDRVLDGMLALVEATL